MFNHIINMPNHFKSNNYLQ